MYRALSPKYVAGREVDPAYEQEVREFISTPNEQERALAAYEDRAEFLPSRSEDRRERALTRMESENVGSRYDEEGRVY